MKAIQIYEFGPPDVLKLEEVARPEPGPGEVLVRVHAAGVNPVDWKVRAASSPLAQRYKDDFPLILGWDVSGVVAEVGETVVDFEIGDEVFGLVGFPGLGRAYGEYLTAPASHLALKPRHLDHVQAAALPLVALTAWQALFEVGDLQAGQRLLVHAAAGGVGHVAVQLAKWRGAYVIGTASARHHEFLRDLGVDEVIDYTTTRFEDVVHEVDMVLDPISGETRARSWQVLKKGGILVSILSGIDPATAADYGVRSGYLLVRPDKAQLHELARLADGGHLRPAIDAVFPLHEAAQAHARGEQWHTGGKIVLQVV